MEGGGYYWGSCPSPNPFNIVVTQWDKGRKDLHVGFASDPNPGRIANVVTDSIRSKVILIGFNLEPKPKNVKSYIGGSRSIAHVQNVSAAAWQKSMGKHHGISADHELNVM